MKSFFLNCAMIDDAAVNFFIDCQHTVSFIKYKVSLNKYKDSKKIKNIVMSHRKVSKLEN